jgi:hypothetical protein
MDVEVLSQHPSGDWKTVKTLSQDSRQCPGQGLNLASEYNSEVLLLAGSRLTSFVKRESVLVDIIHRNNVLSYTRNCNYPILSIQMEALKGYSLFFSPQKPQQYMRAVGLVCCFYIQYTHAPTDTKKCIYPRMLRTCVLYATPSNPGASWNLHTILLHSSKQDVLPVNRGRNNI